MPMARSNTWKVKLVEVHALVDAVKCFPENTPRRWHLISQLLSYCNADCASGGVDVEVGLQNQESSQEPGKKNLSAIIISS